MEGICFLSVCAVHSVVPLFSMKLIWNINRLLNLLFCFRLIIIIYFYDHLLFCIKIEHLFCYILLTILCVLYFQHLSFRIFLALVLWTALTFIKAGTSLSLLAMNKWIYIIISLSIRSVFGWQRPLCDTTEAIYLYIL